MPYQCPEVCWSDVPVWRACCRVGRETNGDRHSIFCPWKDPGFPAHLKRQIWRNDVKLEFAKSTQEVLDLAFLSRLLTPSQGADVAREVIHKFFLDRGTPTEEGVAALANYNRQVRELMTLERCHDSERRANAASAARLLGRPDLAEAIADLLREPAPGSGTGWTGFTTGKS